MTRRLRQIDKLLRIKELRRRLAEMDAAKARRAHQSAIYAVHLARENEAMVRATSEDRRMDRLERLMEGGHQTAVLGALAVSTHQITEQEIDESRQLTAQRDSEQHEAAERAKVEQSRLAQSLRVEERTKKLCERLAEMKQVELARTE